MGVKDCERGDLAGSGTLPLRLAFVIFKFQDTRWGSLGRMGPYFEPDLGSKSRETGYYITSPTFILLLKSTKTITKKTPLKSTRQKVQKARLQIEKDIEETRVVE